jgi:hypothetical protein
MVNILVVPPSPGGRVSTRTQLPAGASYGVAASPLVTMGAGTGDKLKACQRANLGALPAAKTASTSPRPCSDLGRRYLAGMTLTFLRDQLGGTLKPARAASGM